jgi:hypothetical protein
MMMEVFQRQSFVGQDWSKKFGLYLRESQPARNGKKNPATGKFGHMNTALKVEMKSTS